jgi:hypothetical protein
MRHVRDAEVGDGRWRLDRPLGRDRCRRTPIAPFTPDIVEKAREREPAADPRGRRRRQLIGDDAHGDECRDDD